MSSGRLTIDGRAFLIFLRFLIIELTSEYI